MTRRRAALLAATVMVVWPACSDSDERTLPGRASPESESEAAPTRGAEASPEEEIENALARFNRSVKDEDARSTANLLDRDTIRYLKRLRNHVGSAGRGRIAKLTPWEKLALTGLRTDFDERTLGALSVEGFLDHVLDYEEIFLPFERLELQRVRVEGSRAVAIVDVARLRLKLERSRGSWRIDARPLFYRVDEGLRGIARDRGHTVDEQVLRFGERITAYRLTPDVWEKPR
jgi:hypothetical protein